VPASSTGVEYTGVIDFAQERSIYNCGAFWKLYAPGRDFIGEPGAWEADDHYGITREEPFWLLELLKATVDATAEGTQAIRGAECRHYRGIADFRQATATATLAMEYPLRGAELDLGALAIEAWVDATGRIRRAVFHGVGSLTTLDLFDFGEPVPIELPRPSEILPNES
jgi:hypothetical protein